MSNYNELVKNTNGMQSPVYVIAALTDEFIVDKWPMKDSTLENKHERIIEVRVFNESREVKLFRPSVGDDFCIRIIDDCNLSEEIKDTFEQEQYLDIDTKRTMVQSNGLYSVTTIGGGKYSLPVKKVHDVKIIIKYYLTRDKQSGMAKVYDWRVKGFKD